MVELIATPAVSGLPVTIGAATVSAVDPGPMYAVAPFKGQAEQVGVVLGGALPKAGRSTRMEGAEIVWFSRGQWMWIGAQPGLEAGQAAVTDQSDAWCTLELKGAAAEAVLARLVPIDVRRSTFKRGHCARTQLNHMATHLTRTGAQAFRIMVFRSMAGTAVHELGAAMTSVSARG